MQVDRKQLKQYVALKKEIEALDKSIDKLYSRVEDVPEVLGKVQSSSSEWPYIETRVSVRMAEPKEMDAIKRRILFRKRRKEKAEVQAAEIEEFISGLPDSIDRQIFEMVFLEGKTYEKVGESVGYTKGRVSQKISEILKD